jgi:hypothetical protein
LFSQTKKNYDEHVKAISKNIIKYTISRNDSTENEILVFNLARPFDSINRYFFDLNLNKADEKNIYGITISKTNNSEQINVLPYGYPVKHIGFDSCNFGSLQFFKWGENVSNNYKSPDLHFSNTKIWYVDLYDFVNAKLEISKCQLDHLSIGRSTLTQFHCPKASIGELEVGNAHVQNFDLSLAILKIKPSIFAFARDSIFNNFSFALTIDTIKNLDVPEGFTLRKQEPFTVSHCYLDCKFTLSTATKYNLLFDHCLCQLQPRQGFTAKKG